MTYTSLYEAREKVLRKESFRGNSVYAIRNWNPDVDTYTVYSYGKHFPMYVYDFRAEQWYGNNDKYSVTTSKHQSKCRPPNVAEWYPTETMKLIARGGIKLAVSERLN